MRPALAIVCALTAASTLASAQQQPIFRAGTDAVLVDVFVRDKHEPVLGLQPASFELRDNNVVQKVTSVSYERAPLSVTLVVETSTDTGLMAQLDAGVAEITRALQPDDRCALITFGRRAQLVTGSLTRPLLLTRPADLGPPPLDGVALVDAVTLALATPTPAGRRSLVLIVTSGWDSASFTSYTTARELGWRTGAIVSTIQIRPTTSGPLMLPGGRGGMGRGAARLSPAGAPMNGLLLALANATGGAVRGVAGTQAAGSGARGGGREGGRAGGSRGAGARLEDSIAAAMRNALDDARTSYVLSFTPLNVNLAGWHNILVRVKDGKDFEVRARQGYFGH